MNYERQHSVLNRFRLKNLQEQIGSTITAIIPSLEGLATNEKLAAFEQKTLQRFLDEARALVTGNDTAGHEKAKTTVRYAEIDRLELGGTAKLK